MRIDMKGQGIDEIDMLQVYARRRLLFVLSRFGAEIIQVGTHLSRIAAGSGQPFLRCHLTITLYSGRKIVVEVLDRDAYVAIDQAVERARRLIRLRVVKSRAVSEGA